MDFHIWKYTSLEGELFSLILAIGNAAFDIHSVFLVALLIWQLLAGSITRESVLTNTKHEIYPFNKILSPQYSIVNYMQLDSRSLELISLYI